MRNFKINILLFIALLFSSSAVAGTLLLLQIGSGIPGGGGATNFLLSDNGSALLVDVGSKFLVQ